MPGHVLWPRSSNWIEQRFPKPLVGRSNRLGAIFIRPYIFSEDDQESVVYRSSMLIHNYPGILKKCGFRISGTELLKTGHSHDDYRILSFTAIHQRFLP